MKAIVIATLILLCSMQGALAYDCYTVREYVRQYGRAAAITWALSQGYTAAQINAVRRACLR